MSAELTQMTQMSVNKLRHHFRFRTVVALTETARAVRLAMGSAYALVSHV